MGKRGPTTIDDEVSDFPRCAKVLKGDSPGSNFPQHDAKAVDINLAPVVGGPCVDLHVREDGGDELGRQRGRKRRRR